MSKRNFVKKISAVMLLCAITHAPHTNAINSIWNGTGSNNDLNNQNNWIPNDHVPNSTDVAEFNSAVPHINKTPNASLIDFSVDSIHFTDKANPFSFTFDNCTLVLNENGITGNHTDTTIHASNLDNSIYLGYNLYMSGSDNTLGQANVSLSNSGTLQGSIINTTISRIDSRQINAYGPFSILSGGQLNVTNTGLDETNGGGGNVVAEISYEQAYFDDTVTLGNDVVFSFSNSGTNKSTNNTSSTYVADTLEGGVYIGGKVTTGNNVHITVSNAGDDSSTGVGGNETGYIDNTAILECNDDFQAGSYTSVNVTNSGKCTGTTSSSRNTTGYTSDEQFYVQGTLTAGDFLNIHASNSGEDTSTGVGNNRTGYMRSSQINFAGPVSLGGSNHSTFSVENKGIYSGSASTSANNVGAVNDFQIRFNDSFAAGNNLTITASNYGEDNSSGVNGSLVGYVSSDQVNFTGSASVGNKATITASNECVSTTTTTAQVGYISGNQIASNDIFNAGKDLTITATNKATISGNSTNKGITNNQIIFDQLFTAEDGAQISAYNLGMGSVNRSQISFEQGFNILNGKATFKAVNEGTISRYGIEVGSGSGGNANILLGNSSLYVRSSSPDFTISSLNGDATSYVKSRPTLIIDTDAGVKANFAGDIQDYSSPSNLIKTGLGTQKLSGTNTFTGLTTVQEGTLVLTGSLAGNVNIDAPGILKGTGRVAGNVLNLGTIAPGESIGTIHFLSNFTNTGGNYEVEVSGTGASDLIQVTGNVDLDGGLVIVSSVDGTYKFQDTYTIVAADGTRTGFYTDALAVSSMVQPVITYDAQHVYLTLLTDIQNVAETPNQYAVAEQLDGIVNPNDEQNLLLGTLVNLPVDQARDALDSLSGYQHAADFITAQIVNRQFIRRLYDPLRSIVTTEPDCCSCDCCGSGFTGWLDVGGTYININNNSHYTGLNSKGYNITGGIQNTFCRNWTLGIAGAYEQDDIHFKNRGGSEHCNTWLVGLYGLYRPSCFYLLADFAYGNSSNTLKRSINVGDLHYKAKSHPDTQVYTFYGEIGVDLNTCCGLVQPFFGVETGTFKRKHVHESFAEGWGLDVNKRNRSLTTTRLGVHLTSNDYLSCDGNLSLDVAWNYLVSDPKNRVHEQFYEFGNPFEIEWTEFNRSSVDYALTYSIPLGCNLRGYIEGSGESWKNANVFNILAGVEFSW